MIEAAHNEYAARSMKLLQGLSRRFWYMHYREAADLPLCARLHANQARAIAAGRWRSRGARQRQADGLRRKLHAPHGVGVHHENIRGTSARSTGWW